MRQLPVYGVVVSCLRLQACKAYSLPYFFVGCTSFFEWCTIIALCQDCFITECRVSIIMTLCWPVDLINFLMVELWIPLEAFGLNLVQSKLLNTIKAFMGMARNLLTYHRFHLSLLSVMLRVFFFFISASVH